MRKQTTTTNPRLGTIRQAAELMCLSDKTIRRLIADGTVKGYRVGRRAVRVGLDQLATSMRPIHAA
jgi:excisionase family DNA binding protein